MRKRSKRYNKAAQKVERGRRYPLPEAIDILKSLESPKFDESVTLTMRLGIDPRKSDQIVRGAFSLPHGIGKTVSRCSCSPRVTHAERGGGGRRRLSSEHRTSPTRSRSGWMDFDVAIAHPVDDARRR